MDKFEEIILSIDDIGFTQDEEHKIKSIGKEKQLLNTIFKRIKNKIIHKMLSEDGISIEYIKGAMYTLKILIGIFK